MFLMRLFLSFSLALPFVILSCGKGKQPGDEPVRKQAIENNVEPTEGESCGDLQSRARVVIGACSSLLKPEVVKKYTGKAGGSCGKAVKRLNLNQCEGLQDRLVSIATSCSKVFREFGSLLPKKCKGAVQEFLNQ